MLLGVNIDHVAFLREARKINDPDPLWALFLAVQGGADQITIHLREDRRHIHDDDAKRIIESAPLPVNIESSIAPHMIEAMLRLHPHRVTLVPENRQEVTTEGGLDATTLYGQLDDVVLRLKREEIEVSLFVDPTVEMVRAAKGLGVEWVELHTGSYANLYAMRYTNLPQTHHAIESVPQSRRKLKQLLVESLAKLEAAAQEAQAFGLHVAAGHGLNCRNVAAIAAIDAIEELNIGQSIVARSVFCGMEAAVREMKALIAR